MTLGTDISVSEIKSVLYVPPTHRTERFINYYQDLANYELILKLDGSAITTFNGKRIVSSENTLYILPRGKNRGYHVEILEPGACIDIFFQTSSPMPGDATVLFGSAGETLRNLFLKIQKVWYSKHDGYYYEAMSIIYRILREINKGNYIPKDKYTLIEPAVNYISEHFRDRSFDYKSLHIMCGISYTYFKKIFTGKFGITPVKYVTDKRIKYSCDLLNSGLYSITEVSALTGFENVYYFSRVFKNIIGTTPGRFGKE